MPGPPAPFVPTPLPNIGKSGNSPQGYSTTVTIEGHAVAIRGASFNSTGDVASQGTGGGIVSSNTQGPTKFAAPGSLDVKIEGKNVQLLGDQMLNNCGPSGSPPNAATMAGLLQGPLIVATRDDIAKKCNEAENKKAGITPPSKPSGSQCTSLGKKKHKCCEAKLKEADYSNVESEKSFSKTGEPMSKGPCKPDVTVTNGGVRQVFDFKFNCKSNPEMSKSRRAKYKKAFKTNPVLVHAF
jgi:uncharacterized Zn-binding protein involved in type VI secretion